LATSAQVTRRAHVGVTYLEDEAGHPLAGVPLYRERYRFITIAGAPLARRRRVTWAEVATQPLGLLTPDMRNRRLIDACDGWAFSALKTSPGARVFYDQHKAAGAHHHAALRTLANRLVGILHGCLEHQTRYDETIAWGHRNDTAA